MSKYEIEIPDDQLGDTIWALTSHGLSGTLGCDIAEQLKAQAPIPAPTKRSAVVRVADGIAVLADPNDVMSWINFPRDKNIIYEWSETPGKILEILFEGVDD